MTQVSVPKPGLAWLCRLFRSALEHGLTVALAAIAWALAPQARAGASAPDAAAWAPEDIDLLVAVDAAASLRAGPFGPTLTTLARNWLAAGDLGAAWQRFSALMGLDEPRAFDALLGRRAVFVSRGAEGQSAWAMVSLVDAPTERLLRERLQPAPRKIEGGLAVLSLEDGRFWLAVGAPDAAEGDAGDRALLLGPAAAPQVFDQLAATLGREAPRNLARTLVFQELAPLATGAAALVMVRLRENQPGVQDGWLAISARVQDRSLAFGFVARTSALSDAATRISPWTRDAFLELAEGGYAAVMEWVGPGVEAEPDWTLRSLLALTRIPFGFGFEHPALLGPRRAMVLRPSEGGLAGAALAMETHDTESLAGSGDRYIGSMISLMAPPRPAPGQAGAQAEVPSADFGGQFPEALREVDLSRTIGVQFPKVFDRGPSLAWVYAPTEADWAHPRAEDERSHGWWIMGLDRSTVASTAAALADARVHREKPAPWVSLGLLRPSLLVESMERRGVAAPPAAETWLRSMRAIGAIEWEAGRAQTGSIVGRARVSLAN